MNEQEFGAFGQEVEERVHELQRFLGELGPKLLAIQDQEGQATMTSVLVKQFVTPFYMAFPGNAPRAALMKTLEDLVGEMRDASQSQR